MGKVILDSILDETSFLSQELIKKLDDIFVEGTYKEKLNFIIEQFLKWHTRFPYLTIQRPLTPEDADFPPCPLVKAIYWEGEFLGFHCRAIKPPAFDLPKIRVGRLTLKVTTPEDCWDCIELCKKQKVGLDLFGHIPLEQITLYKRYVKDTREASEPEEVKAIKQKLANAGIRKNLREVQTIFKHLTYNEETKQWKGITEASKRTGVSRPTIYKLVASFPKGIDF